MRKKCVKELNKKLRNTMGITLVAPIGNKRPKRDWRRRRMRRGVKENKKREGRK